MINDILIRKKIKKISQIKDLDLLRYEMYSIFTELIFSKKEFKSNLEIEEFLKCFGIEFRAYVFKTRGSILSNTLKIIKASDYDKLSTFREVLTEKLGKDDEKDIIKKVSVENISLEREIKANKQETYIKSILNKYSRNKEK